MSLVFEIFMMGVACMPVMVALVVLAYWVHEAYFNYRWDRIIKPSMTPKSVPYVSDYSYTESVVIDKDSD